jgi:ribose 5-phosphate isomerase RpiB
MKNVEGEPDLTYLETGFMSALLLNLKAVDFVVGGCGTGQGYINAVLQFPGVSCGLLVDPVDSFLYSQVNAGNCVSLALNKGYGLGGDLNLRYLFAHLFNDTYGQGYPPARKEIQAGARKKLEQLSITAHKPMKDILSDMDKTIISRTLSFPGVLDFIKSSAPSSELKEYVLTLG